MLGVDGAHLGNAAVSALAPQMLGVETGNRCFPVEQGTGRIGVDA
jgi:hypothetical protein